MLAYQVFGTGPQTIVLLHGFCENSTCFNEQVFLLKDRFKVVCIDLPGFGYSANTEANTLEEMADAAYEIIAELQPTKPVLFGHSMGGYVALALAKKYESALSGLGLIHSTALPDSEERKQKRNQAIAFIKTNGTKAYVTPFIPPLFHAQYTNQKRVDELTKEAVHILPEALIRVLEAMRSRPDSTQWLSQTHLPVCFIAGAHDAIIPLADMASQAALCQQASFYLLQNSAHMGMIEEAEKCSKSIADFCADIAPDN